MKICKFHKLAEILKRKKLKLVPGTYNTNVTSVNTEQKAEKSAMNVPSQHTPDMVILQNAFTDALFSMNKSQSALLQQFQINFSKSIENSLKPVIDNIKTQSHVFQQLNDSICKKENIKHDKQPYVEKLR
jgi:hypothetical protein